MDTYEVNARLPEGVEVTHTAITAKVEIHDAAAGVALLERIRAELDPEARVGRLYSQAPLAISYTDPNGPDGREVRVRIELPAGIPAKPERVPDDEALLRGAAVRLDGPGRATAADADA